MKAGFGWIQTHIDRRAFSRGMACVAAFYLAVFGILWLNQSSTIKHLESQLTATAVNIEYPAMTGTAHPPMPEPHGTPHGAQDEKRGDDLLEEVEVGEVKAMPPQAHTSDMFADEPKDEPKLDAPETFAEGHAEKDAALASAPIAELIEDTEEGPLPKISAGGLKPFNAYKRPQGSLGNVPVIALAVKDYGLSKMVSEQLLADLPSGVTFILSPYAEGAEDWQKKARAGGHEIWLELPLEDRYFPAQDPGPLGILSGESLDYNKNALLSTLGKATGYAGVAGFADESFVNSRLLFQNLLRMIFDRGLGYFEINPDGLILIEDFSSANEAPYARNGAIAENAAASSFKEMANFARNHGYTVTTVSATPGNIATLQGWIKSMQDAGIHLVPLSYIAQPPALHE